jgi:DNA-binding CsgD family transcriptional regulator/tetratricopeptide (TPR) repeat protein
MIVGMTTSRIATHGGANEGPIFGRERELAQLDELLDGVPERGAALLLRGEAGIGKSVLLAAASRRAQQAEMQVLRANGVQSETQLPFAGLHQLLLPVLGRVDRLPTPQRDALLAAFGMTEAAAPDRFLIALAVLELLSEVAERTPLLVVAEDAQWLDRSSTEVLAFVARRVEHEPIVVLAASRDDEQSTFGDAGLPELRLGGLADAAAGALLDAQAPNLTSAVRELLLEQAEGNPLALVELPILLSEDELGGHSPLPAPLPLTERLGRAFAVQAAKLPPPTRTLLLLTAADDYGVLGEVLSAAAASNAVAPTVEDFAPAVDARLVRMEGTRITFRHPLVRSAVYQRASIAERRAAHAAWAGVLADQPDRQVWHRAAALVGPDESVATKLAAAATRARRRGAISVAVSALERAVELSEDRTRRAQRLLDAAEVVSELGRRELALGFVAEAEQLGLGAGDRQRAILIQDAFDTGEDTVRVEQIIEVAEQTWHRDADLAMNVLRRAAGKSWWLGRSEELRELLVAAVERLGVAEDDPQRLAILAMVGSTRRTANVLGHLSRSALEADGDPVAARVLGLAGYAVGHCEYAVDALTVAIAGLRTQGRLALQAQAVVARAASGLQLGRWALAILDAEEGYRLSMQTAQPLFGEYARAGQALLAGLRGDEDEAEALAAEAERAMVPMRGKAVLWDVQLARAITALGAGRYADAYEHLIRTFDPNDPAEHYRKKFWAVGDLAEAALHSERREEARVVLAQAEAEAGTIPSPRLRVALEYARPLLAEDDEAEALYEAALGTDLTPWPFARARLQLEYGTWLRRQRRVIESRVPLSAAKGAFAALGAASWSQRVRHELRAAGVGSLERKRAPLHELTPQEQQIVRLAASGLSNREIGQQLYISHRTVGAHLYRAFPKLGITSRGQLREALDNAMP